MEKNTSKPEQGLYTDNSFKEQPKGTYSFALNAVNETNEGDSTYLSTEEANEIFCAFKPDFIPLGKCYLSNGDTAIFSVTKDNTISEIGILQENKKYVTYMNDEFSTDKLMFNVQNQIDATYRLRRGCERNVYFTDNLNPPRFFNFDKPEIFKTNGVFSANRFSLFRNVEKIPKLGDIKVLENNGRLTPGSYTILLQYLDENFNGTAFYEIINNINIYNDSVNDNYSDIVGAMNLGEEESTFKYDATNKSIEIKLDNIDENFTYIRLAIIEYTDSVGTVSDVKYSAPISTRNPTFVYTGENAESQGSVEEVQFFNIGSQISTAEHIEQIENRLILGNIKGEQADICALQKYASRIKADCIVKDTILTSVKEEHNTKNPLVKYNGLSYQPGEVYSFGIMYQYEDNTFSPVMHIPGKNPDIDINIIFSPGNNTYPMSNEDNINVSERYLESEICNNKTFWGIDSEGVSLADKNVRHHRFPTRNDYGIPFVEQIDVVESEDANFRTVRMYFSGRGIPSVPCEDGTDTCAEYYLAKDVLVKAEYTVTNTATGTSNTEYIEDALFPDSNYRPEYTESRLLLDTEEISNIKLYLLDRETGGVFQEFPLTEEEGIFKSAEIDGYSYAITEASFTEKDSTAIYKAPIFGIKFSGIELPPEEEIGKRIIGYQIVRQERTRFDRTILDSGVVLPMIKHKKFCSSSLIAPDWEKDQGQVEEFERGYPYFTSKRNVNILSLTHKFTDDTYDDFTEIEEVGSYKIKNKTYSGFSIPNVLDGSSAEGIKIHKTTADDDGFTLKQAIRSTEVEYTNATSEPLIIENTNTQMYNLGPLDFSVHKDGAEELVNMSCDNKSLILSKNDESDLRTYVPNKEKFPYVYIKKANDNFYANFRNSSYYTYNTNIYPITQDTCEDYYGDTYISPMRYSTNIYANFVAAKRTQRFSLGKILLMGIVALVGAALAIFTGGSSAVAAAAIIGGIAMAAGASLMVISAIVEQEKFAEVYDEKWEKGLDKTVQDIFFHRVFINAYKSTYSTLFGVNKKKTFYNQGYYRDDTFRWFGEIIGDLWFESPVNFSLRFMPRGYPNNFLKPLKPFMIDRPDRIRSLTEREYLDPSCLNSDGEDGYWRFKENDLPISSKEDRYFYDKTIERTNERNIGYKYLGISRPQIYGLNTDYNVFRNFREYFAIPLEYDCCSKCRETFPHRYYWSEQSFQEEQADNFRIFLPNNYRDIEGETGAITDIFRYSDNIYIHTEEALWVQPKNHQERVTDEIVSFIGTGDYFSIPPKKIIDDDTGSSAGTEHKWGTIKTPYGIFFVSEREGKIFQFDGKLKPITSLGMENYFQNNIPVKLDKQYYKNNNIPYPFKNNPSNIYGTGFISTYDSTKERIIYTKKDKQFTDELGDLVNYNLCVNSENLTVFLDVDTTIANESSQGWNFVGIEDCEMKFSKETIKTRTEIRETLSQVKISNTADIWVMLDMSGSFNNNDRQEIVNAVNQWKDNFAAQNPDWEGTLTIYSDGNAARSENWIQCLDRIFEQPVYNGVDMSTKDIVVVSFVNENGDPNYGRTYHPQDITNPIPAVYQDFIEDRQEFINKYNQLKSFNGILYPIVRGNFNWTRAFLQHGLASLKGTTYTQAEMDVIEKNPALTDAQWNTIKDSLVTANPYNIALADYGWQGQWNRTGDGSDVVIDADQFQEDIDTLLEGVNETVIEQIEVEVEYIEVEYKYVPGVVYTNPINNNADWTMSYSLKKNTWTSWHSYLPSFYVHIPEKFHSWINTDSNFWEHNIKGKYNSFYGQKYPFVVEYVSLSAPLQTRIWEDIKLHTEARRFKPEFDEFVDERFITFNKALIYNSRQCTGEMSLRVKDLGNSEDYITEQVINLDSNTVIIDRNERDWTINDIRDIRVDYEQPIFNSNINAVQDEYFIDKVLNEDSLDVNKDWMQMELLRDKYLVVRLIFDNFEDVKLTVNYSVETESISHR